MERARQSGLIVKPEKVRKLEPRIASRDSFSCLERLFFSTDHPMSSIKRQEQKLEPRTASRDLCSARRGVSSEGLSREK